MRMEFDMVVVGSGFAGSLMATIASTLGLRVALVEKGRHPRFAMGESSTPLANLLLEELCRRYGLDGLLPLVKWGSWQEKLPQIACGLKRGFSFVHHQSGEWGKEGQTWDRQLMVAASPRESIADTHWFREDFDQYFLSEAQRHGVSYFDEWESSGLVPGNVEQRGEVRGSVRGTSIVLGFGCLIDASGGGGGIVGKWLGLKRELPFGFPETRTVYSHFSDVALWEELHPQNGMVPYPIDASALHHVFEDGWAWVLRFNNGLTSAGVIAREGGETARGLEPTCAGWNRFLERFPSIGEQFKRARPVRSFMGASPVAFMVDRAMCGRCVLLPSAAGFVDPMFSTGFPLTLLGIERLAAWVRQNVHGLKDGGHVDWNALALYEKEVHADLDVTARFMSAIYRVMGDFPSFHSMSLLYFAAAIYSETLRRLGREGGPMGFLLRNHEEFHQAFKECCQAAGTLPGPELRKRVETAIRPIDIGGLLKPRTPMCYWAESEPMLLGARLVGATQQEMVAMLEKVEFWK